MTIYDDTKWWIESLKHEMSCYYTNSEQKAMFMPSRYFTDKTSTEKKGLWLKNLLEIIDRDLTTNQKKSILANCSHVYPVAMYKHIIQKYKQNHDLNEALILRHEMLIRVYGNEKKNEFRTIDSLTLNQIKHNPIYETGIRKENFIHVIKIPDDPKHYYLSKNLQDKCHYYCHCPWIKDLIKKNVAIPGFFCYCGAGQYKNFWENVTGQHVDVAILKSVLRHDDVCEFKIIIGTCK